MNRALLSFLLFACCIPAGAQPLPARPAYQFVYAVDPGSNEEVLLVRFRIYNRKKSGLRFLTYTCHDAAQVTWDSSVLHDGQLLQCRASLPVIVSVGPDMYHSWTARFERTPKGRQAYLHLQPDSFRFRLCMPRVPAPPGIVNGPVPPTDTLWLDGSKLMERQYPLAWLDAARPKLFEYVFRNFCTGNEIVDSFHVVTGDTLHVRSGRLALSKVEGARSARALPLRFPKGRFPVEWSMGYDGADSGSSGYTAYARIRFSGAPVTRWAPAIDPGEPLWNDGLPPPYSFPEESGAELLLFGDADDVRALGAAAVAAAPVEANGSVPPGYHQHFRTGGRGILLSPGMLSARSAYVGYDAQGRLACLLIDTGLYQFPPSWY
ncbi:MAG: hypothetical protein EOO11_01220 [Chitinophagaceae bacterium]|nr:MAG: hypothetical protein EOO11_01220 [Chitinophagaceae bacterium]